jgi:putative aldouronate transport system substrate-binding protein
VQDFNQYKAKIESGRVLALSDAKWEISEPVLNLIQSGEIDRTYGYYPLTLNKDIKYAEFVDSGYLGGWGIGITKNCKDIERAIQFFDWMCTEEAQILTHWGVEGIHYTIKDGKKTRNADILSMSINDSKFAMKTGIGMYLYPFPTYGNMHKDSNGENYITSFRNTDGSNISNYEKEILNHYNVKSWKELYPSKYEFPIKPYGAAWLIDYEDKELQAINEKVLQIGYKLIPKAILSKPDEFDNIYDQYIAEVKKAGIEKLTDEFEIKVKERIKLWNK